MALPSNYTRLEYIQSSGTQYIDTGFKPNHNTRVVMDAQIVDFGTKGQFLFGARGESYKPAFAFFYSTDGPSFKTAYSTASVKTTCTDFTARVFVDQNKNVCKVNGVTTTHTASTFQNTINMYLMASNENGTTGYYTMMRLYSCQIYDNGTLIRDFVPCKNASGEVGLYDVVNGTFYENKGSGTFTAGTELTPEYKIVDSTLLDAALTATADAIRTKSRKAVDISWNESAGFASEITNIQATPNLQAKTATPSTSSQTVKPDISYDGLSQVTVKGDANLKAANIAKDVSIFGVIGTLMSGAHAEMGTIIPTTSYDDITITHGLNCIPKYIIFFANGKQADNNYQAKTYIGIGVHTDTQKFQVKGTATGDIDLVFYDEPITETVDYYDNDDGTREYLTFPIFKATKTSFTINTVHPLVVGQEYVYFVWGD